jgi:NTP pyrophosphatase (non-canonical NTP hydrolase)
VARFKGAPRPSTEEIDEQLDFFCGLMRSKLMLNSHKPGWRSLEPAALMVCLVGECAELVEALDAKEKGDASALDAMLEAADCGAYLMMLVDVLREHGRRR